VPSSAPRRAGILAAQDPPSTSSGLCISDGRLGLSLLGAWRPGKLCRWLDGFGDGKGRITHGQLLTAPGASYSRRQSLNLRSPFVPLVGST